MEIRQWLVPFSGMEAKMNEGKWMCVKTRGVNSCFLYIPCYLLTFSSLNGNRSKNTHLSYSRQCLSQAGVISSIRIRIRTTSTSFLYCNRNSFPLRGWEKYFNEGKIKNSMEIEGRTRPHPPSFVPYRVTTNTSASFCLLEWGGEKEVLFARCGSVGAGNSVYIPALVKHMSDSPVRVMRDLKIHCYRVRVRVRVN